MSRSREHDEPNAWADDLAAGEAEVPTDEKEVVQMDVQSEMTIDGGEEVHETPQPSGPTPHSHALEISLAIAAVAILIAVVFLFALSPAL